MALSTGATCHAPFAAAFTGFLTLADRLSEACPCRNQKIVCNMLGKRGGGDRDRTMDGASSAAAAASLTQLARRSQFSSLASAPFSAPTVQRGMHSSSSPPDR